MIKFLKSFVICLFVFCIFQLPSEAKKYVIQITPEQVISTAHGNIKVDDIIEFSVTQDVFKNGTLFIRKETPVKASVSFVQDDAWVGDSSLLELSHFETTDVDGNPVIIDYGLKIKGKYGISKPTDFIKYFCKSFVFYANLNYQPKEVLFNILLDEQE